MENQGRRQRQRRLRLVVREDSNVNGDDSDTSSTNLFVRLSPGVAQDLARRSVAFNRTRDAASGYTPEFHEWRLDDSVASFGTNDCNDDDLTFLPLHIVLDRKDDGGECCGRINIYASYNGGSYDGAMGKGTCSSNELKTPPLQTNSLLVHA
jgi:hypothetical protein